MAALGQLTGGIAHDFDNVLMTIILYAEVLLDEPSLPSDLESDIRNILQEAQEASKLVRQILDFSRRSSMETQLLDTNAVVEESADIFRQTLPESFHLHLDLPPDVYSVNADPTLIRSPPGMCPG
jgi:signal transduction histidine kinase